MEEIMDVKDSNQNLAVDVTSDN